MNISLFYHSIISDWNNGNAHFLRGVTTELKALGHRVTVYEPAAGWSFLNLKKDSGNNPLHEFHLQYPMLHDAYFRYGGNFEPEPVLEASDLVIVHEWNAPALIRRIARHHKTHNSYRLLFHDTHHRAFSEPRAVASLHLEHFDGILAYGESIRRIYLEKGWNRQVWTWHEAADTKVFRPIENEIMKDDLVWIGNWGDEERTSEYKEFLLGPAGALKLKARAYGVRYPREGIELLESSGIQYCGRLANYKVPQIYARFKTTLHIPRRPYAESLTGIPTIRPFEALACAIPLISSPWDDSEGLFSPGRDFLVAENGRQMEELLAFLLTDETFRRQLGEEGRRTILKRHTCAHRVRELMSICHELGLPKSASASESLRNSAGSETSFPETFIRRE
ncbi:MAG: glycosyltransferase [Syntrophales bacterium]|nr:glycosyltransferase [Syntrophales bacterium]MDY0044247.1 glycosyltransferase [Syntrophales bacterium]